MLLFKLAEVVKLKLKESRRGSVWEEEGDKVVGPKMRYSLSSEGVREEERLEGGRRI